MKEFFLDEHSNYCIIQQEKGGWFKDTCKHNPHRFLFFAINQFVLVTYYTCLHSGGEYDFKMQLIDSAIGNTKIINFYDIKRSITVDDKLRDFRIRNKALKKTIQQVNYVYYDNAMKKYAITTTCDFMEILFDQEKIKENYKIALKFLQENEYLNLIPQLEELFLQNYYHVSEAETIKTIDHLINTIKQTINGNN